MPDPWFNAINPMPRTAARRTCLRFQMERIFFAPRRTIVPRESDWSPSSSSALMAAKISSKGLRTSALSWMSCSTASASTMRPFIANHLGLSGRNMNPTNSTNAGAAAKPMDQRHPATWCWKTTFTSAAANCPNTTFKSLSVTTMPRISGGDNSAEYIGTVPEAKPIAMPRRERPTSKVAYWVAQAMIAEPMMYSTAEAMMTGFRPIKEFAGMPMTVLTADMTSVIETTHSV
mmetsp:Transcript_123258/g.356097  ORF Transcript_123258/g.356097 Transcript_123258/m.356097 type:complete len:232 (+) Transcript_123258:900-1595(+)